MMIIGVGCGPDLITIQAARLIFNARRVAGSQRALDLAEEYIQEDCQVEVLKDYSRLNELPPDTVLLSTGDPMLAGLRAKDARYIPGISSLQLAFARLRLPLDTASVVLAHGRHDRAKCLEDVVRYLRGGKNVFMVAAPGFDVKTMATTLKANEIDCKMAICQDLGYPEESIIEGTPSEYPLPTSDLFAIVVGRW